MKDIGRISELGIDVLLVEHDMKVIMGVCQQIVCVDHGVKIAEGTPGRNPAGPQGDRSLSGATGRKSKPI